MRRQLAVAGVLSVIIAADVVRSRVMLPEAGVLKTGHTNCWPTIGINDPPIPCPLVGDRTGNFRPV